MLYQSSSVTKDKRCPYSICGRFHSLISILFNYPSPVVVANLSARGTTVCLEKKLSVG